MDPVANALAYTVEHGGGTFEQGTLLPFEPKDGYAVAVGGVTINANAPASVAGMLIKTVAGEYNESFVGTWLNGGALHIDATRYFNRDSRADAIAFGHLMGQQAIRDFAAGDDIYLDEEGA